MKIFISLPDFYFNFYINNKLFNLLRDYPHYFKEDIAFLNHNGSFPYCYWNGASNSNIGDIAFYKDFMEVGDNSPLPISLNFSNVNLTEQDFYDTMVNTILKYNETGANYIEVSNLSLLEYIKNRYPHYKFILSKNADLINELTTDLIDAFCESEQFEFIEIPERLIRNLDIIKSLKHKSKLVITVNSYCCSKHCDTSLCSFNQQTFQYNFSSKNIYAQCPNRVQSLITIEDIQRDYLPLGINKFKINSIYSKDTQKAIEFYISYFIKPKFYKQAFEVLSHGQF